MNIPIVAIQNSSYSEVQYWLGFNGAFGTSLLTKNELRRSLDSLKGSLKDCVTLTLHKISLHVVSRPW